MNEDCKIFIGIHIDTKLKYKIFIEGKQTKANKIAQKTFFEI